jgi:hypothetical protein
MKHTGRMVDGRDADLVTVGKIVMGPPGERAVYNIASDVEGYSSYQMAKKRTRRVKSVASELVRKAREAMLTSVQVFNNPQIEFKSELFIVTNIIAWTYLLHAHYRKKRIEYRRRKIGSNRFQRTKHGAIYHLSLEECLDHPACPLDDIVKKNLEFLIGIRHEIEHQMTRQIDDQLSAKFQASALNFNDSIKKLFGKRYALDSEQAFSIQFAGISEDTMKELMAQADLPQHIQTYIVQYENGLTEAEYNDPRFSYRVAFVRKTANAKTAADKVVEFVPADSELGAAINQVFLKETEKMKYRPSTIVKQMKAEGFTKFSMRDHTILWQGKDAKNAKYQYGTQVEKDWYWYQSWVSEVRKHCEINSATYKPTDPSV